MFMPTIPLFYIILMLISKLLHMVLLTSYVEKSLKIPKGQSESVYQRRTDNTMAKSKSTKGQRTIYNTYI
jgi:hypothetical protein